MPVKTRTLRRLFGLALLGALVGGCTTVSGPERARDQDATTDDADQANDPLTGMNRRIFAFNEDLDAYALEPAATAWSAVTPAQARRSVGNFFDNLSAPGQVLNNTLQGKPQAASTDAARFFVNSTIGVAGLFDVASGVGLETRPEDFGQTLGVWGVDSGAYLMLPLLGPSSTRDIARYPVAWYTDILTYVSMDAAAQGGLVVLDVVNQRAQLGRALSIRDEAALDAYAFTRSSYRQQRRSQVHDGEPAAADDNPYGDFFDKQPDEGSGPPPAE